MTIPELLRTSKTIAVIGISSDSDRPSYSVAKRLMRAGYTIVPVNPRYKEWEGLVCYSYVSSIPENIEIDIVDIFRRSEATPDTVLDVLKRKNKPRCIWLQSGIRNVQARHLAESAGIFFVEDRCTAVEVAMAKARV